MRGNQRLSLPTPEHVRMMAERDRQAQLAQLQAQQSAGAAAAMPAAPAPIRDEDKTSIQRTLDKIRTTPGQ
jgi:hypothetical protein